MPHHMRIRERLHKVENATQRIESATEEQPHRPPTLKSAYKRNNCRHGDPAHDNVCHSREISELARRSNLEQYPRKHHSPFNPKHAPGENRICRTKRHKAKGSVAARDEKEDGHVVQHFQYTLRGRMLYRVISRRDRIKQNDTRSENRCTGDFPGDINPTVHPRPYEQRQHGSPEVRSDDMRDRIGDLLSGRLLTQLFSVVFQDFKLFSFSIASNIASVSFPLSIVLYGAGVILCSFK